MDPIDLLSLCVQKKLSSTKMMSNRAHKSSLKHCLSVCVTHRGGHHFLQVVVLLLEAKVFRQEILVARSLLVQIRLQLLSLLCDCTGHFL